jgi:hypothetical protein
MCSGTSMKSRRRARSKFWCDACGGVVAFDVVRLGRFRYCSQGCRNTDRQVRRYLALDEKPLKPSRKPR